ncbi:MAG: efflux RND transporter permease subunit [Candidatus Levybacteria bacterium]|nr:efflux RND transporter permease subunit [Candidatus Levybacteria bacterium]
MKETSYLHHLKFPDRLKNSFIASYLSNPRLLILLLIAIIGLGGASFASLPRRLSPEIKIPLVIISTVLPGANPQDVESLVTIPIEDGVNGIQNLSKITSTSSENVSVSQLEFESGVDPDKARADVQAQIDQVELPDDAIAPNVQTIDFENQPVWTFSLIGKGDVASLNRFSKLLKSDLEALSSIDNVTTGGLEDREISVAMDQAKMQTYGLSPIQLSSLVKSALNSFPAGQVTTNSSVFSLSVDPTVTSIDDVRNLQVKVGNTSVPLYSIATVIEKSKPNQFPSFFATKERSAERSITFSVYKTRTADINKASKEVEKKTEEELAKYDGQFTISSISNAGKDIDEQFSHLIRDFMFTIILVFIVLFVFLGARQAVVSLFAVPLTFLISFAVMGSSGISLNFLSMFSLLLSLGLLVDDTIVVISAMSSYYRSGKFTPLETGLLVWRDFIVAILTTTLTTVFAFLPLLISTGIIGEYIKSIPIVVSSTLIASFGVAMLITLPLMIFLLKPGLPKRIAIFLKIVLVVVLLGIFISILPKGPLMFLGLIAGAAFLFVTVQARRRLVEKGGVYIAQQKKQHETVRKAPYYIENGLISFDKISNGYKKIILKILNSKENRRKAILMVVLFSIFSYLLVPFGFVKNEFFPQSDAESIGVNLELPSGTNATVSEKYAREFIEKFRKMDDVSYVTADIGQASGGGFGGASASTSNAVSFSLVLDEDRSKTSIDIAQDIREEYASFPSGKVTISEGTSGPPAGADLQINLFGDDLSVLDLQADKIIAYLQTQKGTTDVSKSIKPGTSKIVFVPDQAIMSQYGVSNEQVGLSLRTFATGFTLDTAKLDTGDITNTEKQDITLRMSSGLQNIQDLSSVTIATARGSIPLSSLGKLELRPNPTLITREDGERTISVTAGVQKGFTTTTLNTDLERFAQNNLKLPDGYTWKTGGVNEENQKSVNSILQAMLISFLLIIVTMVIQFGSFRKAVIVMLVIPLSISGVFIIFSLTQTPLSFPALIGVLALFGIVVKNSILIIDKISANEKIGMDFIDGIVDGASSRLEPIALTSLAAIMGLIPITISDPLWRGLGGAIIAGLTFSGTIMLFFIPVVYYAWFSSGLSKKRAKKS